MISGVESKYGKTRAFIDTLLGEGGRRDIVAEGFTPAVPGRTGDEIPPPPFVKGGELSFLLVRVTAALPFTRAS
ncbi:MAG: hypothetical protein GY847_06135 [Proteobacteria bacterium]|nr:hypothetical protein [Pseudomonadota bacterium]